MAQPARAAAAGLTDERAAAARLLRALAAAGVALMLVVIVSSAYLRLVQAGLSCSDWPACYGRLTERPEVASLIRFARISHRIAASAVGIVVIALILIAAAQRPRLQPQTAVAAAALLIALGLAGLGAQSSASVPFVPLPGVTLLNLGGGFALLALLWWLKSSPPRGPPSPSRAGLPWLAGLALGAAILQIVLGGLVSAKFAALSCPSFPACGAPWSYGDLASALDPTQRLATSSDGAIVRPPALAALAWAHRIGALVVIALTAVLALRLSILCDGARRVALTLAGLLGAQLALGATAAMFGVPLPLVLAHNLTAALLLCALVSANHLAQRSAAAP
jgi:heme A synthase